MSKRALVGLVAALGLVAGACGDSSSGEATATSAAPPATEAIDATSGGGLGDEAIEVHGHWELEVFDADGTTRESIEFTNAFTGAGLVQGLLARTITTGPWSVLLANNSDSALQPCLSSSDQPTSCSASEPDVTIEAPVNPATFTLNATITIERDGAIDRVLTRNAPCDETIAPANCDQSNFGGTGHSFSAKSASDDPADSFEELPVSAGQIVQVSVTFSFS